MAKFTFYWLDGKREVLTGDNPANALNSAGYGHGALKALDFYAAGDCRDYKWKDGQWQRIGEET